jgi:hypothetical protein
MLLLCEQEISGREERDRETSLLLLLLPTFILHFILLEGRASVFLATTFMLLLLMLLGSITKLSPRICSNFTLEALELDAGLTFLLFRRGLEVFFAVCTGDECFECIFSLCG